MIVAIYSLIIGEDTSLDRRNIDILIIRGELHLIDAVYSLITGEEISLDRCNI